MARPFGLGILVCACATQHGQVSAQAFPTSDIAIFSTVLGALSSDTSFKLRPIVVDPRPLVRDDSITSVQMTTFAPVSAAEIAARRSMMHDLRIEPGDAVFPSRCGGRLVPSMGSSDSVHAGCPSTSRLVVAVGLPRMGDRTKDEPDVNSRFRTARVILADIAPNGISADVRDYVLEGDGTHWRVIKWKRLGFWE